MNKRERFAAFLNNEPVDRVPVGFFHHYTTAKEYAGGLGEEKPFKKLVNGHWVSKQKDDPDFLKIMNDMLMMIRLDVSGVKTAADLKTVRPPALDSLYAEKTKQLTEQVLEYYKDEDIPSLSTAFSPSNDLFFSLPYLDLTGGGAMNEFLEEDPVAVQDALKRVAEMRTELNRILMKEFGVDGIYLSVTNMGGRFPEDLFAKYIAPVDKEMVEAIKEDGCCILHVCGYQGRPTNPELFKDYAPSAVNWACKAEGLSLGEGKALFGGIPVLGGFDQTGVIYTGSKEEVKAEVFALLSEAGQKGVALGSDCTVPDDFDEERVQWVRDAAIEFAEKNA